MTLIISPFEQSRLIGTVSECTPTNVRINLPHAGETSGISIHGESFGAGEVGEFVCIETSRYAILGRINLVKLPERERTAVEPHMGKPPELSPIGVVQLLSTISLETGEAQPGIASFPRIGASVYTAHPDLLCRMGEFAKSSAPDQWTMGLAVLARDSGTPVRLTPEKLFGRHCAILGATGGGKSWTIARIIESLQGSRAKVILLDATGEYHTARSDVKHVHFGSAQFPATSEEVVLPYKAVAVHELVSMFRPSGQAQGPKLRAAIKTLKLLKNEPNLSTAGVFVKANQSKASYYTAFHNHLAVIDSEESDFDISKLAQQIEHECCFNTNQQGTPNMWGGVNGSEQGYCASLISRIITMASSVELACIFRPGTKKSLLTAVEEWLADPSARVLRVSMKSVSFAYDARSIVANSIGKYLLKSAREGKFLDMPLVLILDEAHNFINRSIGEEGAKQALDAFENIAREGRKFNLTITLATQRPRDLPESVLSQMGTMIVHRLTNNSDRDIVEKASGDIDRAAASFLPSLSPGEAVLIGTDFAFPLAIRIVPPVYPPDSRGPDYQIHWAPAV
jgi:hypothetical protein